MILIAGDINKYGYEIIAGDMTKYGYDLHPRFEGYFFIRYILSLQDFIDRQPPSS